MPKKETRADRFLDEHPDYDGRGVVVAVFDTGVDPGAPGLQETSDGRPKIIDVVDGSGSGDVRTTTVRTRGENGTITGLSGRVLTIPDDWSNPSGEWRVGIKAAYEIFPRPLVARLKERRADAWDARQRAVDDALRREISAWDAAHVKPTREELKDREELAARLEQLQELADGIGDPGPVFDCVVFNDGEVWRAAIDTDEDGDLGDERAMTNFRVERQYATFGDEDLLNFAVNIYEDGAALSIVTDCGAHGTHVAGIVSAHYPGHPELDGIAPGAQIVSVKIGNSWLGSSSLGTGETRGIITAIADDVDLINMSYGGGREYVNVGRGTRLLDELVNDHGVIFVSSAGNSGPALSTVGGPGGTTSSLIGVGAVISPAMMAEQYASRAPYEELQYTWSSRGPVADGDLGVDISAPGGAISPVPTWTLQPNMLMNGTSMASPNACGAIALLLSGLKAEGLEYSPQSVKRALQNTARPVPGGTVWEHGAGMIQVDQAWDSLVRGADRSDTDVRYTISLPRDNNARGVYLREPSQTRSAQEVRVDVTPKFPEQEERRRLAGFEMAVRLEPTEPWVTCGRMMRLTSGGSYFDMVVDPSGLEPGAHFASVFGYDETDPAQGPLFRVPITALVPERTDPDGVWRASARLEAGQIFRTFIEIPAGASWVDVAVRRDGEQATRLCVLHLMQMLPDSAYDARHDRSYIRFYEDDEEVRSIAVEGPGTLELDLAHYWSTLDVGEYDIEARFHGIRPDRDPIVIETGPEPTRVLVSSSVRAEELQPSGSITAMRWSISPSARTIRGLDRERDRLSKNRQIHELIVEYPIEADDGATLTIFPALSLFGWAYEEFESLLWMVFDENDRVVDVKSGDDETIKLDKGSYTLRLHIRHDDVGLLERASAQALIVNRALDKPASMKFFASPEQALHGGSLGTVRLSRGQRSALYVGPPDRTKLPKWVKDGQTLVGTMTFGSADADWLGAGSRPGGFGVLWTVPPKAPEDATPKASDDDDGEKSPESKLAEAVRDTKLAQLKTLKGEDQRDAFDGLYDDLEFEWPGHLPLLLVGLDHAQQEFGKDDPEAVLAAADEVLGAAEPEAVRVYFGVDHAPQTPAEKTVDKDMKERRDAIIEALRAKARAVLTQAERGELDEEATALLTAAFNELDQWGDLTDDDTFELQLDRLGYEERFGQALGLLGERMKDEPTKRSWRERQSELLRQLGWEHLVEYADRWEARRFPDAAPLM